MTSPLKQAYCFKNASSDFVILLWSDIFESKKRKYLISSFFLLIPFKKFERMHSKVASLEGSLSFPSVFMMFLRTKSRFWIVKALKFYVTTLFINSITWET